MFQSEKKWDNEWSSGAWDYMESVAVERARIAVIGGVLVSVLWPPPLFASPNAAKIQMYSQANSSVLDVGCGEGAIADFLSLSQKSRCAFIDWFRITKTPHYCYDTVHMLGMLGWTYRRTPSRLPRASGSHPCGTPILCTTPLDIQGPCSLLRIRFVHASAYDFAPTNKFDVVAFSDVLYYVNYDKVSRKILTTTAPYLDFFVTRLIICTCRC